MKILVLLITLCLSAQSIYAANLINLKDQNSSALKSFVAGTKAAQVLVGGTGRANKQAASEIKTISEYTDPQNITHTRVQQYYQNYPVWNAHAAIHHRNADKVKMSLGTLASSSQIKKTMNGRLYAGLSEDLNNVPVVVFTDKQKNEAINEAINQYKAKQSNERHITVKNSKAELIVFMDKNNKAQWSYKVSFDVFPQAAGKLPAKPNYLINAIDFKIYHQWDNIKTINNAELVKGGGFGGNIKSKLIYDDSANQLAAFTISRSGNTCYLENPEISIKHAVTGDVMHFQCDSQDKEHNNIYWSGDFDLINQSYSPANDAMFGAQVIKKLYKNWYNTPVLAYKDGSEQVLQMNVHVPKMDNAYWDGESMTFGDGDLLYPLTSLGIAAHEVSHGFTEQHSNLNYYGQSGGMNEAYSDMAAQTAEYYVYGQSSWLIGSESLKIDGEALRYMDQPSKDCYGKSPGAFCSIDSAKQYYEGLNVHLSSGVYNRAFYLLSTSNGWDTRKAFAVMLHANASYWLADTQFNDGAACAIQAAKDLGYDSSAVKNAFNGVGVDIDDRCINEG